MNGRNKAVGLPPSGSLHSTQDFSVQVFESWHRTSRQKGFLCCPWRRGSAHSPPAHHLPQGVVGVVHRYLILHSFPPPPFLWDSLTPALPSGTQSYYCRCSAEQVSLSGHPTSLTIMSFTQTAHHAADVPGHQSWGREKDESK